MEEKEMQKEKLLNFIERERKLNQVCDELELSQLEVLSLLHELKNEGLNIISKKFDDDIYMVNVGDSKEEDNSYEFETNLQNEFKFIAISDTRLGSKSEQLSILNDIYEKGHKMGYDNVILCGNISAGYASVNDEENFIADSLGQADYIINNYPKVEGMKTYFVTGKIDEKHLRMKKINIGKRISEVRDDLIYLGNNSCNVKIDNVKMQVMSSKLAKTYTVSYRAQQQIDAYRSEDKPDILLLGGLLQMEKFPYRNVHCISVPSVLSTTKEMTEKRHANTVGAWYVTVKTNTKGMLESVNAISSPYYVTNKNDYLKVNNSHRNNNKITEFTPQRIAEGDYILKIYKYIKDGMSVEDFMLKHRINSSELNAILEMCSILGKEVSLEIDNNKLVFSKKDYKLSSITKLELENSKLYHNQIGVVSDTHLGNIHNQLHLLNNFYEEAYNRGINTILHVGDLVDGFYTNRPEGPRQQFLHGFDEQAGYVVDMYPKIDGLTTYYILGSHDETHYKNGQATISDWVSRCRSDMIYLGQDTGEFDINKVKIILDHPGGGSSKSLSYQPQRRIEQMESHNKPNILLIGHYHKNYSFLYRNIQCVVVPSLCDTTQFQQKQGLSNSLGAYILNIYSDRKGNIQYFEPEPIIYDRKDVWEEAGKDKKRVRKLEINNSIY